MSFVEASWRILEDSPDPGGIARYPIKTLIPVSMVLLFVQGVSELIKNVATLTGQQQTHAEEAEQEAQATLTVEAAHSEQETLYNPGMQPDQANLPGLDEQQTDEQPDEQQTDDQPQDNGQEEHMQEKQP
jgi:hypothetical protein